MALEGTVRKDGRGIGRMTVMMVRALQSTGLIFSQCCECKD